MNSILPKSNPDSASHLILLPTLACPASCSYCFGPHANGGSMTRETLEAVVRWKQQNDNGRPLEITFHGGEPLVPGAAFYRMALPLLRTGLAPRPVHFALQSNLWLLDDQLGELFQEYRVSLGTSLDGPEAINDAQRGAGYYQKTMRGIKRAHQHGLNAGCICTFTTQSARQVSEVFEFFLQEGMGFSAHAAVRPFGHPASENSLSPEEYGQLLVDLLPRYLNNITRIRISTLDAMSRSISTGKGVVCTFSDCLGHYMAIDPGGWIYPCQRMAGIAPFRLGNVHDCPTMDDIVRAPIWRAMQVRQERIAEYCGDCPHLAYCRGGCPYNVLAANNGQLNEDLRDPHCPAYRRVFEAITERALGEVFSEQNLNAVLAEGLGKHGMLHKGMLLQVMRGSPHPQEIARQARQAVAAVALAVCHTPEAALQRLEQVGVITNSETALGSLRALRSHLDTQSKSRLMNAYLHVTDACNLVCRHCYAVSRKPEDASAMSVEDIIGLTRQAAQADFRKVVITGGEPLIHPQRDTLLDALTDLRKTVKPMQITLRTNLAYTLSRRLVERVLSSADEIVVSVDGDPASHEAQRGKGSYACTIENLHILLARSAQRDGISSMRIWTPAQISLAATLTAVQMEGPEGDSVRVLGEELDLRVRIKPVLPLGRGAGLNLKPSFYSSLDEVADILAYGVRPAATCGLGMSLYVGSDGTCYPCYALMAPYHYLGNALRDGLLQVLASNDVYRQVTVDSNQGCRTCALRYLCGGYCRAWNDSDDPNMPPTNCEALYARAQRNLGASLEVLGISTGIWQSAGLP
jgi:uncharacterized protein